MSTPHSGLFVDVANAADATTALNANTATKHNPTILSLFNINYSLFSLLIDLRHPSVHPCGARESVLHDGQRLSASRGIDEPRHGAQLPHPSETWSHRTPRVVAEPPRRASNRHAHPPGAAAPAEAPRAGAREDSRTAGRSPLDVP